MAKATILLVEDSQAQAGITKESLQRSVCEVVLASDGISAIKDVAENSPDLVLYDLILPGINGAEICRWIKINNYSKVIPAIMQPPWIQLMIRLRGSRQGQSLVVVQ